MQSMLRKLVMAPAVLVVAGLLTSSAMAATTIKVPFSFKVGEKWFPAGYYVVDRDDSGSFVSLTGKNTPQSATWVLAPGSPAPTETKIALRFSQFGDTHVLQSVQYGALITSRLDKNTERNNQMSEGR